MSWNEKDVYYNPEVFGLEQRAHIDYSDGNYYFDYRVVWQHKETGKLYTARDSGCSCPSPFEKYTTLESLTSFNGPELIEEARDEARSEYYRGDPVEPFISAIRKLMEDQQ